MPILSPRETDQHKRLDRFLSEAFPEQSRSQIQKWIDEQQVLLDGKPVKAGYKLRGKEQIEIRLPEAKPCVVLPEAIPLDIVFEDSDLAVINKPAGMVVHIGAGVHQGTLVNALLHHFHDLSRSGGTDRPGIVHRLDKQTSGLLVVAKNDFSHAHLSRQFQSRAVTKRYLALVHGQMSKPSGEIQSAIGRDRANRLRMSTRGSRSREAHTVYEVVERFLRFTLLQLTIKTGRTHQIRVHLSSIKHPVVGDTLYGAPPRIATSAGRRSLPTLDRNFLHAAFLKLLHPRTQQSISFSSDLPQELASFLDKIRKLNSS
ncbi:MAG: RluA family pseudouridine synthase [Acidobacteria bacterium]|nr:RluA family pseudouridine synthase [Acidobacteriota bacterium]MCI0722167.1 RluA family pseudouridine synthase [Acidobacteriota bacterium]